MGSPTEPDASGEFQRIADCLAGPDADTHHAGLQELEILTRAHPALRQPAADAVCRYLRGPVVEAVDSAVALLVALARGGDHLAFALEGAVLPDVDFSGCSFGPTAFTDAHFRGRCVFDGAHFRDDAIFARAVFEGEASFADVRFGGDAHFGLARFHSPAGFAGARFDSLAWFGRGEEPVQEDDSRFEEFDEDGDLPADKPHPFGVRIPWREPNEADPDWPNAVLEEDYQTWYEGSDGACFRDRVSFHGARFHGPAWFWKARFGADAEFGDAWFGGQVHLDQPRVDLTGATADTVTEEDDASEVDDAEESFSPQEWPFGWVLRSEDNGPDRLVTDESVAPYAHQLADADPAVRLSGLHVLDALGQTRADQRARIVDVVCGFLRAPLAFEVRDEAVLTAAQVAELRLRRTAQQILTDHLRPHDPGAAPDSPPRERFWDGVDLSLSAATLIDFDLSDCRFARADFMGTQFHGTTNLERSAFKVHFMLPGGGGYATFHGECRTAGATLTDGWAWRKSADETLQQVRTRSAEMTV
ncbi:pentapeptide repeat-containing protein [Streptomyces sp. NPDC088350]|uniref:pentapeptide repeat-containing protein n=1 Tax=Streptomyces sp. NPDC088350 TaxID=3365854 RepID=UPI0038176680